MNRSIVVLLLCTLAVATIFTVTSCKGNIKGAGVPQEPGHYLYDGSKWNKIPTDNMITGGGQISLDRFNNGTMFAVHAGKLKYAYRMTPTEMKSAGSPLSNVSDITVNHIGIFPLCNAQNNQALEFISSGYTQSNGIDKSDYSAGYVLMEYDRLPASPIGKYWMHILVAPGYGIGIISQ
ncbi:MAG: hypothetical protein V1807_01380 [Patescibacteria group bacterium]